MKNSIRVYYIALNKEQNVEIPLKGYDATTMKPTTFMLGAEEYACDFIEEYNRQASAYRISKWDWCFSYVNPKYLDECRDQAVKSLLMQKVGRFNIKYETMMNTYKASPLFYDNIIKKNGFTL